MVIITHYDADGYSSAYLLREYFLKKGKDVVVGVRKFEGFGIGKIKDVVFERKIRPDEVEEVYVIDLGTIKDNVESIYEWLGDGEKKMVIMDHHDVMISEEERRELKKKYPGLKIYNYQDGCTTSIVYMWIYQREPSIVSDEFINMVALAGAIGDVQVDDSLKVKEGYEVTKKMVEVILREGYYVPRRYMFNGRFYLDASILSSYLNAPRRVLVGTDLVLLGMKFLYDFRRLRFIPNVVDFKGEMKLLMEYPGVYALMKAYKEWLRYREKIGSEEIVVYKEILPGMAVAVIRSEYDVGGYYAFQLGRSVKKYWKKYVSDHYEDYGFRGDVDLIADIMTGVVIVYNERLGRVTLRGNVPFVEMSGLAEKYFEGGGHVRNAGAGEFRGDYLEFLGYVKNEIYPLISDRVREALDNRDKYEEWVSGEEKQKGGLDKYMG